MLFKKADNLDSKISLSLFINAGSAEPGPPLGTVLGNLGVNSSKFCKEFNTYTSGLPSYFKLKVDILINENRNFEFFVNLPSTSYIISLLKFENTFDVVYGNFVSKKKYNCIYLTDLIKLALFKFPDLDLKQSILMC